MLQLKKDSGCSHMMLLPFYQKSDMIFTAISLRAISVHNGMKCVVYNLIC